MMMTAISFLAPCHHSRDDGMTSAATLSFITLSPFDGMDACRCACSLWVAQTYWRRYNAHWAAVEIWEQVSQ